MNKDVDVVLDIRMIQKIVNKLNEVGKKIVQRKGTENKMVSKTIKKALELNDGMLDAERDSNVGKSDRGMTTRMCLERALD